MVRDLQMFSSDYFSFSVIWAARTLLEHGGRRKGGQMGQ